MMNQIVEFTFVDFACVESDETGTHLLQQSP